MAQNCYIFLLGGIIFSFPITVTTGEFTYVFISPAGNVILPCNNTLSDCTSTTWIYSKYWSSSAEELFNGGQKKNNIQRSERLSLGSDCSLIIYKTTAQDYGQYTCQQFMNGQKEGGDASVFLNVLKISQSSTQTEIRPGSSLTLSCQLFSYESCAHLVSTERVQMVWENQAGVNLQNDGRYHILSSGQCNSSLTTTLLNEDNNRELRCVIKTSDEIKTSATYTVRFKDPPVTTMKTSVIYTVIVVCAVVAALTVVFAAVLWVIYNKRADREGMYSSVVADKNDSKGTYETINISIPPTSSTKEQTDNVTYCEVTATSKQQMTKSNVHCEDEVTYATIKREKSVPQDELYP